MKHILKTTSGHGKHGPMNLVFSLKTSWRYRPGICTFDPCFYTMGAYCGIISCAAKKDFHLRLQQERTWLVVFDIPKNNEQREVRDVLKMNTVEKSRSGRLVKMFDLSYRNCARRKTRLMFYSLSTCGSIRAKAASA